MSYKTEYCWLGSQKTLNPKYFIPNGALLNKKIKANEDKTAINRNIKPPTRLLNVKV